MHMATRVGGMIRVLLVVLVAGALGVPVLGETAVPDYRRGFESFYALGLPDVKEAVYVRPDRETAQQVNIFRRGGDQAPDIGGAWLLTRRDEEEGELLVGGVNRLTVISRQRWQEEQDARLQESIAMQADGSQVIHLSTIMHEGQRGHRRLPGAWDDADVTEDARRLVAFLEGAEPGERSWSGSLQHDSGTLFLLAIHMHRSGAVAEANQVAHLLFEKAGGQQAVIESALSLLADTQYGEVYRAFIASRDWDALRTDIDKLTARFPRGWQRRDAVLQAAAMVELRLAGAPPPLQADELDEADQALAAELAAVDTVSPQAARALRRHSYDLWVLPGSRMDAGPSPVVEPEGPGVLDRIKARGMQAIPLLIALLDDAYPTVFDNPSGHVDSFVHSSSYRISSSSSSPQILARQAAQRTAHYYSNLPRPVTRGEVAALLLQQVVPLSRHSHMRAGENRSAAIRAAATEWYAANQGKTGLELALGYLDAEADGSSFSRQGVLLYLAREGGEPELAVVEAKLLEAEPIQGAQLALQYAQMRGDEARPFVERYIARLKAPPAAGDPGDGDGEQSLFIRSTVHGGGNEQWMNRMISQFESLLVDANLRDLLENILSGEKTLAEISPILHRAIAKETPSDAVGLLLDAACRADDVTTAASLVGTVQMVPYSRQQGMARGGMAMAGSEAIVMPSPAEHRDLWITLLADPRASVDEASAGAGFDVPYSVATLAAYAIEALSAGPAMVHQSRRMEKHMILGERLFPLLIQRATLLVEGEDASALPPFPDAGNVGKEAREALTERLMATESTAAQREMIDALGMDELLAVLQEVDTNNRLRERLTPLANTITSVEAEIADDAIKAGLESLEGTLFSRAAGEQMLAALQRLSPGGKPALEAFAQRGTGLTGVTISLRQQAPGKPGRHHHYMGGWYRRQMTAGIHGMLHSNHEYAVGRWKVEAEPPVPGEAVDAEAEQTSVADSRRQQLLAMMAASGQEIPAEVIAMLENMSLKDLEAMDLDDDDEFEEHQNEEFWETLERVFGEKAGLSHPVMITFVTTAPVTAGEGDGQGHDIMMMHEDFFEW